MSDQIRIDPHVKVLDEAVVERAERRGLDALVYAPHFTRLPEIRRRAERYTTDDLLVVPAREVFTGSAGNRKHVLALGLEEPVPDFIGLDAAMAEFERQDATVLVPHPEFVTVGLEMADLRAYRDVIDAVEVYNPKHWPQHNRRAREIVDVLAVPAFGSSYAHLPWTVGDVWTEVDAGRAAAGIESAASDGGRATGDATAAGAGGRVADATSDAHGDHESDGDVDEGDPDDGDAGSGKPDRRALETSADVEAALAAGADRVRRRTGVGPASRSMAEFLHLFWENSGKKFDRVVCSGQEATHPDQPAYDGRFDDAAVY